MAASKKTTPAKKKTPRFARTPSDTFQTLAVHSNTRNCMSLSWPMAAGLGSWLLSSAGQQKRQRYDALKARVQAVEDLEHKRQTGQSLLLLAT